MNRLLRLLLGLTALLPMTLLLMLFWPAPSWLPRWAWSYQQIYGAASVGLLVVGFYLWRLWRLETIGAGSKLLWSFRFLLTGFIALPLFWYFFVWQAETYAAYEAEDYDEAIDRIGQLEEEEEED
jgi:hypothetical protein